MVRFEVVSTCLVYQAKENAGKDYSSPTRIELTPWDLQLLLVGSIQKGLLFRKSPQTPKIYSLIDRLKTSLSRTLDFFPPLAGRLGITHHKTNNTKSFFIDCNNTGAEFTHVVVNKLTVNDIIRSNRVPTVVHSFFPLNGTKNCRGTSDPLLAIQVTELEDGYFIGLTMNHCVVDGTSFWHFVNTWSEISRGAASPSRPPNLSRWFPNNIVPPIRVSLPDEQLTPNHEPDSPSLHERIFHFSKENISRLKSKAISESGSDKISSLQAVLAHLWLSVTRCRRHSTHKNKNISFKLLIGARRRMQDPPLPENYFGIAVHIRGVTTTQGELLTRGYGWASWQLNRMVVSQTGEESLKFYTDWVKEPKIEKKDKIVENSLILSSSPRFNVYGNDFGWGKPIAVRSGLGNKSDGKITVFSGFEEGSMDIEACLLPETLDAMENDAEFMEFVTI